jgi:hypothetical protein
MWFLVISHYMAKTNASPYNADNKRDVEVRALKEPALRFLIGTLGLDLPYAKSQESVQ